MKIVLPKNIDFTASGFCGMAFPNNVTKIKEEITNNTSKRIIKKK